MYIHTGTDTSSVHFKFPMRLFYLNHIAIEVSTPKCSVTP